MPSTGETAPIRLLIQIRNEDRIRAPYLRAVERMRSGLAALEALDTLRQQIDVTLGLGGLPYHILDLPSFDIDVAMADTLDPATRETVRATVRERLPWLVCGLGFRTADDATVFLQASTRTADAQVGADMAIGTMEHWCPREASPGLFHTRARAAALMRADALAAAGQTGAGVNVILVDTGYAAARLRQLFPTALLGLGWPVIELPGGSTDLPHLPGMAPPRSHGTMVARNVLSMAPAIRLFDLPTVPDRITNVLVYLNTVLAYYLWVLTDIAHGAVGASCPGPWVFCNAWGVYDRRLEPIAGNYTNNPTHPFNLLVDQIDRVLGHDLIFAAGNCGQFCPNERCGLDDRGPGQSILGANSHPRVLTVGAVRADGIWLGYSSQGPGQPGFLPAAPPGATRVEKPDLCAPSHFVESEDAAWLNTGTSAASGLAAGAIAALRSGGATKGLGTEAMRSLLRNKAGRPKGEALPSAHPWTPRLGYGVLDLG